MALAERRVAPGAAKPVAANGGHRCFGRLILLICSADEAGNSGESEIPLHKVIAGDEE